jgi:hypothetical protein
MDGLGYQVRASGTLWPWGQSRVWVPDGTGSSQRRHSMRGNAQKDDTERV